MRLKCRNRTETILSQVEILTMRKKKNQKKREVPVKKELNEKEIREIYNLIALIVAFLLSSTKSIFISSDMNQRKISTKSKIPNKNPKTRHPIVWAFHSILLYSSLI